MAPGSISGGNIKLTNDHKQRLRSWIAEVENFKLTPTEKRKVFYCFLALPLAFLFWGWLRTLITYSLYGAVAGAILRVFMGLGFGYMEGVLDPSAASGSVANSLLWLASIVFLLIAGILAAFKVGELASSLVSGGGAAGAGLMSTVATVITAGKAAVAAKAWGATKAAGAAKAAHGGALPKLY